MPEGAEVGVFDGDVVGSLDGTSVGVIDGADVGGFLWSGVHPATMASLEQ